LNIVHWFTDGLAAYQRLIDEKLLDIKEFQSTYQERPKV
jgi:hypothetical protein